MIIRESPTAKQSNTNITWPPKSPHEVLLSSPSRLKRLQQNRERSISPTPSKRPRLDVTTPNASSNEEEDEEILQLQLKAIEARLKLKKLQKAKQRASDATEPRKAESQLEKEHKILVAHSPKPRKQALQAPESPKRILLGIDKGLKASDVSLRRARSAVTKQDSNAKTIDVASTNTSKSFNERLRASRVHNREHEEKEERSRLARSKGFSIAKTNINKGSGDSFRIEQSKMSKQVSKSSNCRSGIENMSSETQCTSMATQNKIGDTGTHQVDKDSGIYRTAESGSAIANQHCGFSLSKQLIDATALASALSGKTLVSIPQLLKDITSPNYDVPDFPTEDFVVFGIIASKSSPRDRATTHNSSSSAGPDPSANTKFMALTLTDLQWSLDLFLFDTGFSQFWKLTVGTVIAILNPGIMPPKPHLRDTGRFSLKLSSSEDTVLEVGVAQDLGFCKSLKKDGKQCEQWIDKRKTEYCDFHVNLAIEKTTAGRMEINGMTGIGLFGLGGENRESKRGERGTARGGGSWRGGNKVGKQNMNGLKREGQYHDRHLNETAYIIPPEFSTILSAAKLLDAEDYVQGALSAKERSRQRLADHEKERELSKKLAASGNGMGVEYLRIKGRAGDGDKGGTGESGKRDELKEGKLDATELGLVGSSAFEVKLSPVKTTGKKRREIAGMQPMGWGGASKKDLPTRKERRAANDEDFGRTEDLGLRKDANTTKTYTEFGVVPVRKTIIGLDHEDDDDDDLVII